MAPLTILYDPACGLCRRVHGWLADQPKFVELNLLPIKSDAARRRFPKLNHDLTSEDLTVISDKGAVYFGSKAWLDGFVGAATLSRMVISFGFTRVAAYYEACCLTDFRAPLSD